MFDGDGGETLELQAGKIAQNAIQYAGSRPCPQCGVIMNPVQYMYSKGLCDDCQGARVERRVKGRMS
jgi:hypothetical protein